MNVISPKETKIFIMGFGFKGEPETNDVRKSPTLDVVNELHQDFKIYSHDPIVAKEVLEKHNTIPVEIEANKFASLLPTNLTVDVEQFCS